MDSAFAILKAEYDAFKAVVAGRLDALNARVATLEKAAAKAPVPQPGKTVPEERGLCTADTTPAVVEKPKRRTAPLGPGLFDVSTLPEEDRHKLIRVDEFVEVPASPPPTPPLTPPTAPPKTIPVGELLAPEKKAAFLAALNLPVAPQNAPKPVPPGKFDVVFPEYPLPEPLVPVKKARGRPRKAPATPSDTPTPVAATTTQAPAAPQVCASVPAHAGDSKAPVLVPAAPVLSPGSQVVFREILNEHSDDALAKLWERAFGKPLAKFDKAQVVAELLTTYGDPAANFALECPDVVGADPSLKLDPDVEGLDF